MGNCKCNMFNNNMDANSHCNTTSDEKYYKKKDVDYSNNNTMENIGRKINVYIIRHGERTDEISNEDMIKKAHDNLNDLGIRQDKYDPPLTAKGVQQAAAVGKRLQSLKCIDFKTIFASPFIRTLQTANEIASTLNITVTPTLGIGSCAAFVKHYGMDFVLESNYFIDSKSIQKLCNKCKVLNFQKEALNFRESLENILRKRMVHEKNSDDNILVVTHREGICDIVSDKEGCNVPWNFGTPNYCGCFILQYKYAADGKTIYKKWRLKTKLKDLETTKRC